MDRYSILLGKTPPPVPDISTTRGLIDACCGTTSTMEIIKRLSTHPDRETAQSIARSLSIPTGRKN
jgi:hypothetical protein